LKRSYMSLSDHFQIIVGLFHIFCFSMLQKFAMIPQLARLSDLIVSQRVSFFVRQYHKSHFMDFRFRLGLLETSKISSGFERGITSFRDMRKKEKKISHAALGGIFVEVV